jgi:hypothetical protein
MTAHLKSINREVWKVTETKFEVANPEAPTPVEEKKLQCNDIAISALHETLDDKTFEQVKNIEMLMMHGQNLRKRMKALKAPRPSKHIFSKKSFLVSRCKKMRVYRRCFIDCKSL